MIQSTRQKLRLRSVYKRLEPYREPHHWYEWGNADRPTLILLHGFMAHAMTYRRVLETVGNEFHIVVPDLPAHGKDTTFRDPGVEPTIASMTRWLHALVSAFEPPVHLVGHSLGANLSYLTAREHEGIKSLTMVNAGLRVPESRLTRRLLRVLPANLARLGANRLGLKIYEPIQWQQHRMTGQEIDAYLAPLKDAERVSFMIDVGMDLLSEPDRLHLLEDPGRPTMIVWGAYDRLLGVENALEIRDRLPGSHLFVMDDAGHSPMEDDPETFVEALREFLDRA